MPSQIRVPPPGFQGGRVELIDGAELRSYFRLVVEGDQRYFHSKSCHWIGQYRVAKFLDGSVEHADVVSHGAGHVHHQRDGAAVLVVVDEVAQLFEGNVIIVVVVVGPEEFSLGIGPG